MAAKKSTKSKKTASKTAARAGKATKAPAKRTTTSGKAAKKPAAHKVRTGFISHTELVSADPAATKAWAATTFGWKFGQPIKMPDGDAYDMWNVGDDQGGGIRRNQGPEVPGTIPYVEVADIKAGFAKAIKAGATEMLGPMPIAGSNGWMAIVVAPGGPAVGLWAPK